ncbi:hypothetical protein JXC34_07485, partial [Candidatus Woesearchaeota archaeon]|nr:hypothetical protein [Candidatus Woesearchaeota archaeon]
EVMNFGVPGTNALDIYWILNYKVLKYNPDIIIYGVFIDDTEFRPTNLDMSYCEVLFDTKKTSFFSFTQRRLKNILLRFRKFSPEEIDEYYYKMIENNDERWLCFKNILGDMGILAKKNKIRMIGFYIPINNLADDKHNTLFNERLNQAFLESNISAIPGFYERYIEKTRNKSDRELRVDADAGENHYNEEANRIFGENIYEYFHYSETIDS